MDEWVEEAVCRTVDPELWFPEHTNQEWPAVEICASCPVQRKCIQYSFDHEIEFGVWGGLLASKRVANFVTYKRRSKVDRDKMLDRILSEIDEALDYREQQRQQTAERQAARREAQKESA